MIIDSNMQAVLNSGSFIMTWLLHLEPKNRDTGAVEPLSIHTGLDNLTLNIGGVNRTYSGVGSIVDVPQFDSFVGLNPSAKEFRLSILHPEVTNAIRAYDTKFAKAEVHLGLFDEAMNFVGASPVVIGWADGAVVTETDDEAYCTLPIVSNVRAGTKTLPITKSNEIQKLRDPTDNGFKYAAVTPQTKVVWATGEGYRNRTLNGGSTLNAAGGLVSKMNMVR